MPDGGFSIRQRLRYRLESTFAAGPGSLVAWLAAATVTIALLAALVVAIWSLRFGSQQPTFVEAFWQSLLRVIDTGSMSGDNGWFLRIVSLVVTLAGILIFTSLIGLLSTAFDARLADLQRGRSPVAERNHVLILGWSPKVLTIIEELSVANESEGGVTMVLFAPLDKPELDRLVHDRVGDLRGSRVVCRSGQPWDRGDLGLVHPDKATSVLLVSEGADADPTVVKAALAILQYDLPAGVPVVAEIQDPETAVALREATEGRVIVVSSFGIISRIAAQVARQPALSAVYQDLVDFEGNEIYFVRQPELVGHPFGDAVLAFDGAVALGVRQGGRCTLRPGFETELAPDAELIVLAEDDSTIHFRSASPMEAGRSDGRAAARCERVLVLGWSDLGPLILRELDAFVEPGSQALIWSDPDIITEPVGVRGLVNLELDNLAADPVTRDRIQQIMAEREIDHVVILCYRQLSIPEADARALLMLLQARAAAEGLGRHVNVVTELLDVSDVELARSADADEFILSERLTSLVMSQLAENPHLEEV
ncbi:MAG: hypothetical protein QOJ09_3142, partial [Actinomycetota bacterium]|nr:hypothetical protein [Actinomycetota bacterium]